MKKIVRLASKGVGLAAEAIEDHKQKKRSPASSPNRAEGVRDSYPDTAGPSTHPVAHDQEYEKEFDDTDSEVSSVEGDEEIWELDEAIQPPSYEDVIAEDKPKNAPIEGETPPDGNGKAKINKVDVLAARLGHPPPRIRGENGDFMATLPCPVVLPQRRPHKKARGFVRAYAPVLMEAGIDQDTWISFINDWDESSKADPWIDAVFLTAGAVGMYPDPIVMAVTTVVQVVAGTAKELQGRHRANKFLDEMNEKIFKPRGLYALVMAFDPSPSKKVENRQVGLAETISKYDKVPKAEGESSFSMGQMKHSIKSIRVQSGTTHSEFEMPQAAALVYPQLDKAIAQVAADHGNTDSEEAFATRMKNRFKGAGVFVADYADRTAQAEYQYTQPDSSLAKAVPKPSFASKLSDPGHPIHSGSIVSLLSGGHINPTVRRGERKEAKRERRNERRIARGRAPRAPRRQTDALGRRVKKKRGLGIISRIIHPNVLYLLVTNLPSEREMAEAKALMDKTKQT